MSDLEMAAQKVETAAGQVLAVLHSPIWRQGWIGALTPTKCSMDRPETRTTTDFAKETL